VWLLEVLVEGHIVLVTFQLILRATIFDMTFYRDILLMASLGVWALIALMEMRRAKVAPLRTIDRLVAGYVIYGALTTLVAVVVYNVGLLESLIQFRNNFLPVALFFPARRAFRTSQSQARLVYLLMILFIVFTLDALIEFVVLQLGVSPYKIPWYPFMFRVQTYFIGSEVAGGQYAYLHPEDTPALGILGFPNFTAPTLVALFAFVYPFLLERFKAWRATVLGVMALMAVLVFNVQTHLVSGLAVLLVLPALSQPKWLKRNLIILGVAGLLLMSVESLRSGLVSSASLRFMGDQMNRSHLEVIFDKGQISYIANSGVGQLVFGNANTGNADFGDTDIWELRLLFFTAVYGLVWLFLFLGIYFRGFVDALRLSRLESVPSSYRMFGLGSVGMLTVFILDMGHYARPMWAPNIDLWVIVLGVLSALMAQIPSDHYQTTRQITVPRLRKRLEMLIAGEVPAE
jgi:hypothetical protein